MSQKLLHNNAITTCPYSQELTEAEEDEDDDEGLEKIKSLLIPASTGEGRAQGNF